MLSGKPRKRRSPLPSRLSDLTDSAYRRLQDRTTQSVWLMCLACFALGFFLCLGLMGGLR